MEPPDQWSVTMVPPDHLADHHARREAQYQRQLEQLNQQNRHLRTQLETEKTEKQFAPDEVIRLIK